MSGSVFTQAPSDQPARRQDRRESRLTSHRAASGATRSVDRRARPARATGFGRIGRAFLKLALRRSVVEVVAVNDLADPQNLACLMQYDSA
jgi:hypothetical protein